MWLRPLREAGPSADVQSSDVGEPNGFILGNVGSKTGRDSWTSSQCWREEAGQRGDGTETSYSYEQPTNADQFTQRRNERKSDRSRETHDRSEERQHAPLEMVGYGRLHHRHQRGITEGEADRAEDPEKDSDIEVWKGISATAASVSDIAAKPTSIQSVKRRGKTAATMTPPTIMPAPPRPSMSATCSAPPPKCCFTSNGNRVEAGMRIFACAAGIMRRPSRTAASVSRTGRIMKDGNTAAERKRDTDRGMSDFAPFWRGVPWGIAAIVTVACICLKYLQMTGQ